MDLRGGSGVGFRRDVRTHSGQDLRTGACRDWQHDFPFGLPCGSQAELWRGLQGDLQEDLQSGFRGDFEGVIRDRSNGSGIHHKDAERFQTRDEEPKSVDNNRARV